MCSTHEPGRKQKGPSGSCELNAFQKNTAFSPNEKDFLYLYERVYKKGTKWFFIRARARTRLSFQMRLGVRKMHTYVPIYCYPVFCRDVRNGICVCRVLDYSAHWITVLGIFECTESQNTRRFDSLVVLKISRVRRFNYLRIMYFIIESILLLFFCRYSIQF